jgi:hypothetical protein
VRQKRGGYKKTASYQVEGETIHIRGRRSHQGEKVVSKLKVELQSCGEGEMEVLEAISKHNT